MSTIASRSPLNISETVRYRGLVPKDHQWTGNGLWGIQWSDPNTLRAKYLETS